MPTLSHMCDYCQRADLETTPVETKVHGKLRLCDRCKNHCEARGWLKTPSSESKEAA